MTLFVLSFKHSPCWWFEQEERELLKTFSIMFVFDDGMDKKSEALSLRCLGREVFVLIRKELQ